MQALLAKLGCTRAVLESSPILDMFRLTSHLAACRLVEWPCRALRAGLLAIHPARRINQRIPKGDCLVMRRYFRSLMLA